MTTDDAAASSQVASSDVHRLAHRIVANFLQRNGYRSTYESFRDDASKLGWQWHDEETSGDLQIEKMIELHEAIRRNEERAEAIRAKRKGNDGRTPLDLTLAGPSTIPYIVVKVNSSLHPSNILSLASVQLPVRYFCTARAQYIREERQVVCSTGADKNIIFSDPKSGEMIDSYEGGTGRHEEMKHGAAILCTAQNPREKRELASCGMDSKVIIWDMLYGKPIQELRDHSRFVVRCAFSHLGQYLATCSYDRTIRIYKRECAREHQVGEEDEDEAPALLSTRFVLVNTISTSTNPESILFVRSNVSAEPSDPGEGDLQTSEGLVGSSSQPTILTSAISDQKRTWLAYTTRNDCFVHYIALPLEADREQADRTELIDSMGSLNVGEPTVDWTHLAFNTNESRSDLHVSYSLMHLSLHPLGNYLAIQTGDHSIPTTGYAPASSAMSRILLMPLLSSKRLTTIWTGVSSSGFATNRHAWLKDGSGVWLTSEDGILRLLDVHSKVRATVHAHGAAAADASGRSSGDDELSRTASWSRGGNTIIKDVVVLDDKGTVASCGFDHTIRVSARSEL